MVDIDDSKQPSKAETTGTATAASIEANQASLEEVSKHIEVLLHASEAPLTAQALKKHLSLSSKELKQALEVLERRLETGVLNLHETASGYRLQISDDYSGLIQQTFPQRQERLSQALLETLSVIAHKQPVTRNDIEQVRGVTLSSSILPQV